MWRYNAVHYQSQCLICTPDFHIYNEVPKTFRRTQIANVTLGLPARQIHYNAVTIKYFHYLPGIAPGLPAYRLTRHQSHCLICTSDVYIIHIQWEFLDFGIISIYLFSPWPNGGFYIWIVQIWTVMRWTVRMWKVLQPKFTSLALRWIYISHATQHLPRMTYASRCWIDLIPYNNTVLRA